MPENEVICHICDGNGSVEDRKGRETACTYCKGRGYIPKELAADEKEEESEKRD